MVAKMVVSGKKYSTPFIAAVVSVQQWIKLLVHWSLFLIVIVKIRVISRQKIQRVCQW